MPPKSSLGKPKYSEGEKILCFHGPLLYEAKCLGVETKDGQIKYFVHYQGWNKNWDEWVSDARIMKFNAVGLQRQKELKELYSKPGKKIKGLRKSELMNQEYPPPEALRHLEEVESHLDSPPLPSAPGQQQAPPPAALSGSGSGSGGPGLKRARVESTTSASVTEATPSLADSFSSELRNQPPVAAGIISGTAAGNSAAESATIISASSGIGAGSGNISGGRRLRIQIELPRPLKMWMADDCELVARQKRLHILPPPVGHSVSGILGRFVTIQAGCGNSPADDLERERLSEFVAGVQSYFNAVLSTQLLYANERQQYSSLLKSHRGCLPASLYGGAHLVRLFVRLGELLSQTKLDLRCLNSLLDYCDAFLLFVEKNMDTFAASTSYEVPAGQ